ncbi:MAG: (5-formylfuran-3-yl)methyl phosphate synthase, partial [Planctomycetia bacterium]
PAAVKIGLAGAAATDWRRRLGAVYESLPTGSERVAVAYADWRRAEAPAPPEVIAAAAGLGCSTLLIDTFDKSAGGLFACCGPDLPAAWVALARAAGLGVVLAGRIMPAEIAAAWALRPDVVALRSAVCFNGRDGTVQAGLVREAVRLCAAAEAATPGRHRPQQTGEPR